MLMYKGYIRPPRKYVHVKKNLCFKTSICEEMCSCMTSGVNSVNNEIIHFHCFTHIFSVR